MAKSRNPFVAIRRRQMLPRWVRRMDAAAGRRINARHAHPAVDRGYVRLSHAANRGVLWFSIAAVLLVFWRPRAALRGVGSLTLASILANLVGKKLFGGDRPLLKDIPIGRQLNKSPTSGSFPSGHSASAAAFATGVALESPRVGLAVAPFAVGVAYSRLHTGAHWLSDVIGGAALGAGVAWLGALIVKPRPKPKEPVREGGNPVALPALPDGDGAFIVVNPASGTSTISPDPVPVITSRLPLARVHELREGEDLAAAVREAVASARPRVLGVCGGDGTVGAVAQLSREFGMPLLVIPGGTFNHFAGSAGIASVDAAIDALQAGEGVQTDVAELRVGDGHPITVLNAGSVGVYPDFVEEREKREDRLGKWVAALIAAIRVLRKAEPVEVTIDGRPARVWSLFVGVNRNRSSRVAPLQRRRLDDGLLDVRILHAGPRARAIGSLVFGTRLRDAFWRVLPRASAVENLVASELTVIVRPRHGQPPGFAHDGEVWLDASGGPAPEGGYASRIRNLPGGLDVYSPT